MIASIVAIAAPSKRGSVSTRVNARNIRNVTETVTSYEDVLHTSAGNRTLHSSKHGVCGSALRILEALVHLGVV
jgi:hypothetical protein